MNILMTHLHLSYVHGSEIWTHTVIQELNKRGHNVYIWSPIYNPPFKTCFEKTLNCHIVNSKQMIEFVEFDKIILQHITPLSNHGYWKDYLNTRINPNKTIVISHSRFGSDEAPLINDCLNGSKYICISNEIKDCLNNINWAGVLRQPIYDSWFNLDITLSGSIKRILYANHRHSLPTTLIEYCKLNNIHLEQIGKQDLCPINIQHKFRTFDLVIGTGRWIYESLCAGIPCIIGNGEHILDYVTSENIDDFEYYNMTLRNPNKIIPDWQKILNSYDIHDKTCKSLAKTRYHVSVIVDNLLSF